MKIRRAWATAGAALAVGAAVLVPLYGDPRSTPVTHAEWARMLLRALKMDEVVGTAVQASQVFATLSWRNTLAYPADRYVKADGVEILDENGRKGLLARDGVGVASYSLAVVRGGDYRLRVRMSGNPQNPASAEVTALGNTTPVKTFAVAPSSVAGWIDAGTLHLDPGAYTASLVLPQGTTLENVEVAPPCINAVEPLGGWKPTAIVENGDIAVTALKALDLESELPPASAPLEFGGSAFQAQGGAGVISTSARTSAAGLEGMWLRAGPQGLQAVVFVDLPEAGLYSLYVFGNATGQSWLADSCRKAVLCSNERLVPDKAAEWRHVLTNPFTAGRHFFTVSLTAGAVIERLRIERKKDSAADYVATLKRLGFDAGPGGPVARAKAVDAMEWLQHQRTTSLSGACGDIELPTNTLVADGPTAGPPPGGITPPTTPGNPGPVSPPLGSPVIPTQPAASPIQ